jgi:hypothetical protein
MSDYEFHTFNYIILNTWMTLAICLIAGISEHQVFYALAVNFICTMVGSFNKEIGLRTNCFSFHMLTIGWVNTLSSIVFFMFG